MKNMFYYLVCILCYSACNYVSASTVVDYKEIENYVKDNRSGYDALMNRYLSADTTLTKEEIAEIYYGYSFTEDYSPYSRNMDAERAYNEEDFEEALEKSKERLKSNPVSLSSLLISFECAKFLNQDTVASNAKIRFNQVIDMIFDSGDGSEKYPFKVICVSDEYVILRTCCKLEKLVSQIFIKESMCDKMQVILEGNDTPVSMYFDIRLAYNSISGAAK